MRKKFIPFTQPAAQAEVKRDYALAQGFGPVSVGERLLFYTGLLQIRYLPLDGIGWAYLRREERAASVGCRRCMVPDYYLMLATGPDATVKLAVAGRETGMAVITHIAEKNPAVATGYTPENAARYPSASAD